MFVSKHEKHKFCSAAVIYESVVAPRNKGFVRGTMHGMVLAGKNVYVSVWMVF